MSMWTCLRVSPCLLPFWLLFLSVVLLVGGSLQRWGRGSSRRVRALTCPYCFAILLVSYFRSHIHQEVFLHDS